LFFFLQENCAKLENTAVEESRLCAQAKKVTEEHQQTITTMASTMLEQEQSVQVIRDERDVAVTEAAELARKNKALVEGELVGGWWLVGWWWWWKCLGNVWTIFGHSLDNFWTLFGQSLGNLWTIFGQSLDTLWAIFGQSCPF